MTHTAILLVAASSLSAALTPTFTIPSSVTTIRSVAGSFKGWRLTAGGIREYSDSMTLAMRGCVMRAVEESLEKSGYQVTAPQPADDSTPFRDTEAYRIYGAVEDAMLHNVFSSTGQFQERVQNFDYSIGPIEWAMTAPSADAMLVVHGFDEQKTARRERFITGAEAAAVAGAITGILLGVSYSPGIPREDITFLSAGLVDISGRILWYHHFSERGNTPMTDCGEVERVVRLVMESLPSRRSSR